MYTTEKRFLEFFDDVLLGVSHGDPVRKVLHDLNLSKNMLAWMTNDPTRRALYERAQAVGAEVLASQLLELTQYQPAPDEVIFVRNKIEVLKWLLARWNKERYGDTQQLEVKQSVDIGDAMDAAQKRLANTRPPAIASKDD